MSTETDSDGAGARNWASDVDLTWVKRRDRLFHATLFGASLFGVIVLAILIADVILDVSIGIVVFEINPAQFLTQMYSNEWTQAGFLGAIVGSLWLLVFTLVFSFFLGVGTAVYLEEYAPDTRTTRLIEANLTNLAGVPSVVYGLLALGVFVNALRMGPILLAGALALALLVTPIIIVSSQEALRAVPDGVRNGSLATGATQWQTVWGVVLPSAMPGIVTGTILALARAIGETAPLLMVGTIWGIRHVPGPLDRFGAMPTQIYQWAFLPEQGLQYLAAMGIAVLLTTLIGMYGVAFYVRNRYERDY
ncbi:phosphate ABC transporter permease PstA [Natronorubrum daqingense]|uniref:Phosphate transport system permease protein PstA n=1 Tax=Natronorubrum daqingense TaxID=588898 RepID=A0A1N7AGW3_9EURY|nr:phosphate ABC transporter permease PstA [Natronorubrum daqingense]APX97986.1 phosphate ABC transporter, permease protein PstA [Natronorubrum daqingense]SIR38308.1 phosphate transport system permease protein [Natronorubrum daqingense]